MDGTAGIVVVADEPSVAKQTARHLETTLSVSCVTAADPSDVPSLVANRQVDCVVTELPSSDAGDTETATESDGGAGDVFDDVRRYDPTLPVVVYTDVPDGERTEGPVSAGVTAVVGKDDPGSADDLVDWVERAVSARRKVSGGNTHTGGISRTGGNAPDGDVERRVTPELRVRRERLTGIAHDLRNPLGAANVYLQTVRDDCDSPAVDDLVATHERLGELVADLDALVSAGRRVSDPDDVPIGRVARDAWTTVDTDDATLRVETDATVRGDDRRVRRLFENLLANAVTHGGEDVTVVVGDLGEEGADGFVVADDGHGIPPAERDLVFERGYTTADGGTGYGLAIVAELAAAHGWDVTVSESERGGARFEVRTR